MLKLIKICRLSFKILKRLHKTKYIDNGICPVCGDYIGISHNKTCVWIEWVEQYNNLL